MERKRNFTFKYFVTVDEFKNNRGYDLRARLNQGDFASKELAADNFCQDVMDELKRMSSNYRGSYWWQGFEADSSDYREAESTEGFNEIFIEMYNMFSDALELMILYRFEVGNSKDMDKTKDINAYHEDSIELLIAGGFLPRGA